MKAAPTIHAVDLHIGRKLRFLRRSRGLSQTDLANVMCVTFQQVQKYERGVNRICASRLFAASIALQVAPAAFFEGAPIAEGPAPDGVLDLTAVPDQATLAEAFARVENPNLRRALTNLIEVLAETIQDD